MPNTQRKRDKNSDERKSFFRDLIERVTPGISSVEKSNRAVMKRGDARPSAGGAKQLKRGTESIAESKMVSDMIRERRRKRSEEKEAQRP